MYSATFADPDGDGDADLLVSHLLGSRGLTLLLNEEGTFRDGTTEAGLSTFAPMAVWSTTFADIDQDGDLDFSQLSGFTGPRNTLFQALTCSAATEAVHLLTALIRRG
ncbi:MAG: VCBS repeat-containing protein [Sandaracinaceae bacterium]|nr:VCBS repeat-containing protein [Sandaracinaceae bacterium]